jgi:hypothetical protein
LINESTFIQVKKNKCTYLIQVSHLTGHCIGDNTSKNSLTVSSYIEAPLTYKIERNNLNEKMAKIYQNDLQKWQGSHTLSDPEKITAPKNLK